MYYTNNQESKADYDINFNYNYENHQNENNTDQYQQYTYENSQHIEEKNDKLIVFIDGNYYYKQDELYYGPISENKCDNL